MSEIVKTNVGLVNFSEEDKDIIRSINFGQIISPGDYFIQADSSYTTIRKVIDVVKVTDESESHPHHKDDPKYKIKIFYCESKDYDMISWDSIKSQFLNTFLEYRRNYIHIPYTKNIDEIKKFAFGLISGDKSIEDLQDNSSDNIQNETALVSKSSKEGLIAMQKDLEEKKQHVEMIRVMVQVELNKKKAELEKLRDKLGGVVAVFKKKIEKIMRVITSIELYLGINEELFQIQDGEKAPQDTPISFRQMLLYMDEETGNWENGGLDFSDIKWFDEWLITDDNFKKLLPEEKGVVVFRPRRNDKEYGDPFYNGKYNELNMRMTYLLIRNGECLYRVYTDNISIYPRLFPKKLELQALMDELNKDNDVWEHMKERDKDKIDNLMFQYKKRALLLQGLIDRTEVFHPLPVEKINIFDMSNLDGKVNFIYDDDMTLPTGRLSWGEWKKEINSKITKGSRILFAGFGKYDSKISNRMVRDVNKYYDIPYPSIGIYEVEEYVKKELDYIRASGYDDNFKRRYPEHTIVSTKPNYYDVYNGNKKTGEKEDRLTIEIITRYLVILYNPKDTVWGGWSDPFDDHERKNRVSVIIQPDSDLILNYDQISLDDIEFYLTNRVDRKNYLEMMPILENLKILRLKEIDSEKSFVGMVCSEVKRMLNEYYKNYTVSDIKLESLVWETVDWWKFKNMWKRPINKDDEKALRMIKNRVFNTITTDRKSYSYL